MQPQSASPHPLGAIVFPDDREDWIEYGPPDARQRIGFHDYAAIYAVPGLYERVFYDTLGMGSTQVVSGLLGDAMREHALEPARQRALDLGAGNGLGGEELRNRGVGQILAVDVEPEARVAAGRDRPGVYDDYLIADLGTDA